MEIWSRLINLLTGEDLISQSGAPGNQTLVQQAIDCMKARYVEMVPYTILLSTVAKSNIRQKNFYDRENFTI